MENNDPDRVGVISRRTICTVGAVGMCGFVISPLRQIAAASQMFTSEPTSGDQGDGTFLNPIVGGDHPDAGAIRVGADFYLTHTSFSYTPGLIILHSTDLVNWHKVGNALKQFYGEVWAPYLCEYGGRYYIYYPCNGRLCVVHADSPVGTWSEPVSLGISGIDPGHIATPDGRRFLHFAGGSMVELSKSGLDVIGKPRNVFTAWPIPEDWRVQCACLEAPKLIFKNGYFYLNVAEGGTSGPSTSHMVLSARSRNVDGPWEYSPYNPIVHTRSKAERWWSAGHGRLVDDAHGGWWMTMHAYEKGFQSLGRSTLLTPIEWTKDDWFRVPRGVALSQKLAMPPGPKSQGQAPLSDDFNQPKLSLEWQFRKGFDPDRYKVGDGRLMLEGVGSSMNDSPVLTCCATDHSYTVEVDVEVEEGCKAGLLLFYNEQHSVGLWLGPKGLGSQLSGDLKKSGTRSRLRIVNDEQEVDFYYRLQGEGWAKIPNSAEVSGYNENTLRGFLDLRPALFATAPGRATFRSFSYQNGAHAPSLNS